MKNNQQKNRNHQCNQCHQKQQPQRREIAAMLANIDITDNMVSIPRDEYDELVYCSALVDIMHKLYQTGGKYATCDLLEKLFQEPSDEKEDK